MYKFNVYWTDILKINFLQRVILIHSYLYYETDKAIWSDKKYDEVAKQLVGLQNKQKDISDTQYGYVFKDYDGTTGFYLYHRLNKKDRKQIQSIAWSIVK